MLYCIIQCYVKVFFKFISFMKWVLSTVITIILVPKLRPWVSEYIESEFINNVWYWNSCFYFYPIFNSDWKRIE